MISASPEERRVGSLDGHTHTQSHTHARKQRLISMQTTWPCRAVRWEDVRERATPLSEALLCDTQTAHPNIPTPIFGLEYNCRLESDKSDRGRRADGQTQLRTKLHKRGNGGKTPPRVSWILYKTEKTMSTQWTDGPLVSVRSSLEFFI